MAEYFGYMQFFSHIVRYQSEADTSEHTIFYGARDPKEITHSTLLPNNGHFPIVPIFFLPFEYAHIN